MSPTVYFAEICEQADLLAEALSTKPKDELGELAPSAIGAQASEGSVTVKVMDSHRQRWEAVAKAVEGEVATHHHPVTGDPGSLMVVFV